MTQAFLEHFNTQESLASTEIKNVISIIKRIVAAHPGPDGPWESTGDNQWNALKTALQKALVSERDFQILMVLFGSLLTDEWLAFLGTDIGDAIIGDTISKNEKTLVWWFSSIMSDNLTLAGVRLLLIFARYIKKHHPEEFRREFIISLNRPVDLKLFVCAEFFLDDSDKVLLEPLKSFLLKINNCDANRKVRKEKNRVVKQIKLVIKKIEGEPVQKKWWKFGQL